MFTQRHYFAVTLLACCVASVNARVLGPDDPVLERVAALMANMSMTDKLHQLLRPDWSTGLAATGVGLLEFQAIYSGAADATAVAVRRNDFQRSLLTGSGPQLPAAFRLFSIHGSEGAQLCAFTTECV